MDAKWKKMYVLSKKKGEESDEDEEYEDVSNVTVIYVRNGYLFIL